MMLLSLCPPRVIEIKKKSSTTEDLWLDINTTESGIEHFYEFTDFMRRAWNIDDDCFINMQIALSEAVTNAAEYGNKWVEEKQIHIHASCNEDYFTISIKDEGGGFDYAGAGNFIDHKAKTTPGGRGILIMNSVADHVQYSDGGKCVKLIFRNTNIFQY